MGLNIRVSRHNVYYRVSQNALMCHSRFVFICDVTGREPLSTLNYTKFGSGSYPDDKEEMRVRASRWAWQRGRVRKISGSETRQTGSSTNYTNYTTSLPTV